MTDQPRTLIAMGRDVSTHRLNGLFGVGPRQWSRHVRTVTVDRDLDYVRGLRGPDVWYVDMGTTQAQRIHAAVFEWKRVTIEELKHALQNR